MTVVEARAAVTVAVEEKEATRSYDTCEGGCDCASVPMQTLTHYTLYPASLY